MRSSDFEPPSQPTRNRIGIISTSLTDTTSNYGSIWMDLLTDPWFMHKDSCANCGAVKVVIADGMCRTCWRESNGDAEMERDDV
jgi:hypothetical protein